MTASTRFLKSANKNDNLVPKSEKGKNFKQKKDDSSHTIHQKIWQGMNF